MMIPLNIKILKMGTINIHTTETESATTVIFTVQVFLDCGSELVLSND